VERIRSRFSIDGPTKFDRGDNVTLALAVVTQNPRACFCLKKIERKRPTVRKERRVAQSKIFRATRLRTRFRRLALRFHCSKIASTKEVLSDGKSSREN